MGKSAYLILAVAAIMVGTIINYAMLGETGGGGTSSSRGYGGGSYGGGWSSGGGGGHK